MSQNYKGSTVDNAVVANITAQVETMLNQTLGDQARLLLRLPTILTYTSSFFLRYPIELSPDQPAHILIKIRRHPKMQSLKAAIESPNIHINMPLEYVALQSTYEHFQKTPDDLLAVRPLAYFDEFHALVMLEFKGETLRQRVMAGASLMTRRADADRMYVAASKAGRWLREFHIGMHTRTTIDFSDEMFAEETESYFKDLEECRINQIYIDKLRSRFKTAFGKVKGQELLICQSHEDFTTDNILCNDHDELAVIDIKIRSAPVYRDLSLLLIHPDTYRAQFLTFGIKLRQSALRTYRSRILNGYFSDDVPNLPLLYFYCARNVMDKWLMYEKIMRDHSGVKALLSSLIAPQLRFYFQNKIACYLQAMDD